MTKLSIQRLVFQKTQNISKTLDRIILFLYKGMLSKDFLGLFQSKSRYEV